MAGIRRDTAFHKTASHDYAAKGSKLLELAQTASAQFVTQIPAEQARMVTRCLRTARSTTEVFQLLGLSRSTCGPGRTKTEIGGVDGTSFATGSSPPPSLAIAARMRARPPEHAEPFFTKC